MKKVFIVTVLLIFCLISLGYAEKVRILYKPDKSVAIIHPAPNSRRTNETEAEWLQRVFEEAMVDDLAGLEYDDVDISELPTSREHRDEWEGKKGEGVKINQDKVDAKLLKQQQKEQHKTGAKDKLKGLGLTKDEIDALLGE
jgi:hypothetical protein